MASHTGRLYSLALALVIFFLAWTIVAAHPWARPATDPRLTVLAAREAQLRQQAKLVDRIVSLRRAAYRGALKLREARIAAVKAQAAKPVAFASAAASPPSVRVVTLPPLTITRTS